MSLPRRPKPRKEPIIRRAPVLEPLHELARFLLSVLDLPATVGARVPNAVREVRINVKGLAVGAQVRSVLEAEVGAHSEGVLEVPFAVDGREAEVGARYEDGQEVRGVGEILGIGAGAQLKRGVLEAGAQFVEEGDLEAQETTVLRNSTDELREVRVRPL